MKLSKSVLKNKLPFQEEEPEMLFKYRKQNEIIVFDADQNYSPKQ